MKDDRLFRTLEATDENDLDLAISVFRVGIHSDKDKLVPIYSSQCHQRTGGRTQCYWHLRGQDL